MFASLDEFNIYLQGYSSGIVDLYEKVVETGTVPGVQSAG
jgi:hypothetical protein